MKSILSRYPVPVTVRRSRRYPSRWVALAGGKAIVLGAVTRKEAANLGLQCAARLFPGGDPQITLRRI